MPWWILLLTLLAAALRLLRPDASQFGPDDLTMTTLARGIGTLGSFPTSVHSSVAIPNGPVVPYLVAPAAAISTAQPVLLAAFTAYNVAAVPLIFQLGRDLFGPRAGLVAAVLFAVNPWLIVFGRWLQVNALIAPTVVFLLWALARAVRANTERAWLLTGVAAAVSLQVHLSCLANAAGLLGLAPIWRAVSRRGLLLAALAAVLIMLPWLVTAVLPALRSLDLLGFSRSPGWSWLSLQQATRLVTVEGYQAIVDAPLRYVDVRNPPFSWLDLVARAAAGIGWLYLVWLGWAARRRAPATAVVSLAAALLVVIPILALARPPETGNVALVYLHEFLNAGPPLLLGLAALTTVAIGPLRAVATAFAVLLAAVQGGLAVPFHLTPIEEWRLADFSVPYGFTSAVVEQMRARAIPHGAPVFVGGEEYAEQGKLPAQVLRLDYPLVRLHDGRDGLVFWDAAPDQFFLTSRDAHSMSRFLRTRFGEREVFSQELAGTRWTRRLYEVRLDDLDSWAAAELRGLPANPEPSVVRYERAAVLGPLTAGDGPTLAVLWRFVGEPVDPFFTDVVLFSNGQEVLREPHVAYPIAFWESGDWQRLRFLNLFDLPVGLDPRSLTEVRLEHRGILSGRRSIPALTFSP